MEQTITANGIEICYETFGDADAPCVLFVMGLGSQMIAWPESFMTGLVAAGYHVIRYDNRDVGLSQKFADAGEPDFAQLGADFLAGKTPLLPYYLADMAADGIGLLDALGIKSAHVVGASMGGMIAQQMAIDAPERLLSMVSIMSSTSDPSLPQATAAALAVLTQPSPQGDDVEALIDHSLRNRQVIGGDGFSDDLAARDLSRRIIERQFYPVGTARQRAAAMGSGARTEALKQLRLPTLVIHGDRDELVPVECGKHTAEVIPGAELEILPGMGHALFALYQEPVLALMKRHFENAG